MKAIRNLIQLVAPVLTVSLLSACVPVTASTSATETTAQGPTPTTGQAQANGLTLAYESFGPTDGATVLLIAGTGMQLVELADGTGPRTRQARLSGYPLR